MLGRASQDTCHSTGHRSQYRIFGLTLASDFPFVGPPVSLRNGGPSLTFTCVSGELPQRRWQDTPPTYTSPFLTKDGESIFYLYRHSAFDVLRFTGVADFYLWSDRVVCALQDPQWEYMVENHLLGTVLPFWLERKGVPTLHASAIVAEDRVAAFIGRSGDGKSSIAAAMTHAGYKFLTDDILPVERYHEIFLAHPAYPEMRLWPDQAEYFLGRYEHLEQVHPSFSKRRVPIGPDGLGAFCDVARPLTCVYLPERRDAQKGGTGIEIESVSPRDALIELTRHSAAARIVQAMGLQPQRLNFFARLAQQIPMRRIFYPSGAQHLSRVTQKIVENLTGSF